MMSVSFKACLKIAAIGVILGGCSEKMKEAARLEAQLEEMKAEEEAKTPDPTEAAFLISDTLQQETVESASKSAGSDTISSPSVPEQLSAQMALIVVPASTVNDSLVSNRTTQAKAESAEATRSDEPVDLSTIVSTSLIYSVQIASTESKSHADTLLSVYRERGYHPFMQATNSQRMKRYRIRIGRFGTLAQAERLKDELLERFKTESWIAESQIKN
ncbi:MAG: SPOR domain-containing protein [candidate division Zixibacteria bacterium]|nr:SPOR domain-containing protein [candidate division Zixibacteria bacterium]